MSATREYLRSIKMPWFLKKKFVRIVAVITLLLCIPAVYMSWQFYLEAEITNRYRWKHILAPFSLPGIVVMLYACIGAFWLLIKAKQFQGVALGAAHTVFKAPPFHPYAAENIYCEIHHVYKTSPGALTALGDFRVTNFRFAHTLASSPQRARIMLGMEEPDLTLSVPLHEVVQCGYRLDEKNPRAFTVITRAGVKHIFAPVPVLEIEPVIDRLGWRKTHANGEPVWTA